MSAAPMPWEKYGQSSTSADPAPWEKYSAQTEAAPNAGLAPPAGAPPKTLDSGEGPIARGMTSFETQLSKLPGNAVRMIGAKHWPIVDAHNFHELGEDIKSLNPIVKNDTGANGGIDIGATAANVLPLAIDAEGGGIAESPVGKTASAAASGVRAIPDAVGPKVTALGKVAAKDVASHIPIAGRIVQRPSIFDYIDAAKTKAVQPTYPGAPLPEHPGIFPGANLPEHPGIFPGAPEPTGLPEQINPSLVSEARTLPGQISPEVIVPPQPTILRAEPIPSRSGLALPPGPEPIAGSMAHSIQTPIEATPAPKATLSTLEKQISDALGGKPLEKGVPLRNQTKPLTNLQQQIADSAEKPKTTPRAPLTNLQKQIADSAHPLPDDFTPVESSVLKGYKYDPAKQELTAITNTGQRYTHAEVTPEEFRKFEDAESKGTAWNKQIRANHVQVEKNGQPTKPIAPRNGGPAEPILSPIESGQTSKAAPKAATAAAGEDLTSQLEKSRDAALAKGVSTTVNPARLAKRWGVDENSIADTDANVRGMNAQESKAYIDKLAKAYGEGKPVDPVIETRDAANNLISVDGRHRALAAQKAGIGRIPIIVRRTGVQ